MAKSAVGCLGMVALAASLALNVAFTTGCVAATNEWPFFKWGRKAQTEEVKVESESASADAKAIELLREIASAVGVDSSGIEDPQVLKGAIIAKLLDSRETAPRCDFDLAAAKSNDGEYLNAKDGILKACEFVQKLAGKKVLVLE